LTLSMFLTALNNLTDLL